MAVLLVLGGVLLAQTTARAQDDLVDRVTRTYDLSFLTEKLEHFPAEIELAPALSSDASLIRGGERGESALAFSMTDDYVDLTVDAWIADGVRIDPDALVSVIRKNIAEDSWANSNNRISADEARLDVTQTADVHEAIAAFLDLLRERRATLAAIEIAIVPAAALPESAVREVRFPAAAFDEALARAGDAGQRVRLSGANEQRVSLFTGDELAHVRTIGLDSTGVLPTIEPQVERRHSGVLVEVRPLLVEGLDAMRLDLRLERRAQRPSSTRDVGTGEIELLRLAESGVATVLTLTRDTTVLAGTVRDERLPAEAGDLAVLVRGAVRRLRDAEPSPAAPSIEFYTRIYDLGLLLDGHSATWSSETIEDWIKLVVDAEAWHDRRTALGMGERFLSATARATTHAALRDWIHRESLLACELVRVDLESLEASPQALLPLAGRSGRHLDADWRASLPDAKTSSLATIVGVLGSEMRFVANGRDAYVDNVHIVSGGTGYAVAKLDTLDVGDLSNGVRGKLRVLRALGRGQALLEIDHEDQDLAFVEDVRVRFARAFCGGGATLQDREAVNAVPSSAQNWLEIVREAEQALASLEGQSSTTRSRARVELDAPALIELRSVDETSARALVARVSRFELPAPSAGEAEASDPDGEKEETR